VEVSSQKPHKDIAIIIMIPLWERSNTNIPPFGDCVVIRRSPFDTLRANG